MIRRYEFCDHSFMLKLLNMKKLDRDACIPDSWYVCVIEYATFKYSFHNWVVCTFRNRALESEQLRVSVFIYAEHVCTRIK